MRKYCNLQSLFKEEGKYASMSCKVFGYCGNSRDAILSVESNKSLRNKYIKELRFRKKDVIRTIERLLSSKF